VLTPSPSEKQSFVLDDFEGPLDLLLFLVRKNEVNIYDIPIALITEQYLEILRLATQVDLEQVTDFYQLAATLLHIKSRTLLPQNQPEEDELDDPRQDLVSRLIEYQKYKKLAELIGASEGETDWLWERKKKQPGLPFEEKDEFWETIEVWDLLQTFSRIMKSVNPQGLIDLHEEVTVNEKITLILEFLEAKGSFLFVDLVIRPDSLLDIVCAFLAILELVKARQIRLTQSRLYGDIRIEPGVADAA